MIEEIRSAEGLVLRPPVNDNERTAYGTLRQGACVCAPLSSMPSMPYVLVRDGAVIGSIDLSSHVSHEAGVDEVAQKAIDCYGLSIAEDAQGYGYGSALLDMVCAAVLKAGFMRANIWTSLPQAMFYAINGFLYHGNLAQLSQTSCTCAETPVVMTRRLDLGLVRHDGTMVHVA